MPGSSFPITVVATDLPKVQRLYEAAHVLLLRRLFGELDTKEGLIAWNNLIEAHDAFTGGGDDTPAERNE